MERWPLPVRAYRQHRRRRLHSGLACEKARVDAVAAEHRDQEVGEKIVADGTHGGDLSSELGQVNARARRRASHGYAYLVEQLAALAGRDVGDRPPQNVDDMNSQTDYPSAVNAGHQAPPAWYL